MKRKTKITGYLEFLVCFAILLVLVAISSRNYVKTFTDKVITAEFNRDAGTLTFSGQGAVTSTYRWVYLENEAQHVKAIVFKDGVSSIGKCDFSLSHFPNLEKVVFEGDIVSIETCAFAENSNLKYVEFMGDCKAIESLAFYKCYALKTINIPDGTRVSPNAFAESGVERDVVVDKPDPI